MCRIQYAIFKHLNKYSSFTSSFNTSCRTFNKLIASLGEIDSLTIGNLVVQGTSSVGSASINGCIDFGNTTGESLKWTSGSWWQRIYITDDSTADTAVFSF